MKNFFRKFKMRIKTLVQFTLVFGAALLVLLYFLGYYDFSFIDRYKERYEDIFGSGSSSSVNKNPFVSIEIDPPRETDAESESAAGEEESPAEESETAPPSVSPEIPANTARVMDTSRLADALRPVRTMSAAAELGYTSAPADGSYSYDSSRSLLAKMTFDFKLPTQYAIRARVVTDEVVVKPGANGEDITALPSDEAYVVLDNKREARPAMELYMGYILLDDGKDYYILNSAGVPLCRYDADRYAPAFTRDRDGRPLFYRIDEAERTDEETGEVKLVEITRYFHLSEDGTGFVLSEFDPALDGRGLYFDYPLLYGAVEEGAYAVYAEEVEIVVEADEEENEEAEAVEVSADAEDSDTEDSDAEEAEAAEEAPETKLETRYGYELRSSYGYIISRLTSPRYTSAFAFSEGIAAVTTDEDRGSLYFINKNGYRIFANVSTYINEHNRYVTDYLMPPLTHGPESMGHYYYDNGLVRARRQIIDYYNYETRDKTRIVKEYECLLRTDGTEVSLPAGYELEGYSQGIAILSKSGFYGVYDVRGEWIAQPIYVSATPFITGLSVLQTEDGRYGMIDRTGGIVLPFTYDHISSPSSGLVSAYREENGWTIFRMMDMAEKAE